MMPRGTRKKAFIQALNELSPRQQKILLKNANREETLATAELVINILSGHIPLTSTQKRILSNYKSALRKIGDRKPLSWKKRKEYIQRHFKVVTLVLHIANKHLS